MPPGFCAPPVCAYVEYRNVRARVRLLPPVKAGTPAPKAFQDDLAAKCVTGPVDCGPDCNCFFPPADAPAWQEVVTAKEADDYELNGRTWRIAWSLRFEVRVFWGVCAPLGSKVRFLGRRSGGD